MAICKPPNGDDVFSLCSSVQKNFDNMYCCSGIENKFFGFEDGRLFVAAPSCINFNFFYTNDDGVPTLKSPLNGTAQSPWVRVAFQEYCATGERANNATNSSIITTGNISQYGGNKDQTCTAAIKAFQYGWGTVDSGNRCRITIVDEEGGGFETWARRMATNTEGASSPVKGSYKMKVQWGWYISGGGPNDQCGQSADNPPTGNKEPNPPPGQNTSYNICSPTLWFLPDAITVNWENGKFIYTLEGVDLLVRGEEQRINKVAGSDKIGMHFTDAVRLLGTWSMPPFRPRFLSVDAKGNTVSMKFAKRKGEMGKNDSECKGPYGKWPTDERTPLAILNRWKNDGVVAAIDQTGNIDTPGKKIGITLNYDPILDVTNTNIVKFPIDACEAEVQNCPFEPPNQCCDPKVPEVGSLILWASNGCPHCQTNVTDLDSRMKAVYVINGGNCQDGPSVILTEDGWKRINYIYRNKYSGRVACVDKNGNLTWSKITNWYRNLLSNRKMVKVHLHNSRGNKLYMPGAVFTEDHPILTNQGYVEVKNLSVIRHKIHSGTYCPSQEVHEAVIGMMLGDGYIRNKSYSFHCAHSEKQRAYIEHKASMLGLNVIDKPTKKYPTVKITSKSSPYWRSLRKLFYPEGTKVINKEILKDFSIISLAFLYMDDGNISKKKSSQIATCCFTKEEVDLLIEVIKKLGINCYRRKNDKYPRIYFNVEETIKLCKTIAPYIIPSMNYKLLPEYRLENRIRLEAKERPFYDNFDLIRCEKKETKTKYVYCIDVEDYHNFITHSGVVHNCSPVISFNPVVRWHFLLGLKAGGISMPIEGTQRKQTEALAATLCAITGGRGALTTAAVMAAAVGVISSPAEQATEVRVLHTAGNMMVTAIEAELRVQGDPSPWLCSPIFGYTKCVGIIFINPFFLKEDLTEGDCPAFKQTTSNLCNNFLTNKGWFIRGVEHQIKEGSYVTTLKLMLPAPGAELKFGSGGVITGLGGWSGGAKMQFGCLNARIDEYPVGNTAVKCLTVPSGSPGSGCPTVCFQGGGSACDSGDLCDYEEAGQGFCFGGEECDATNVGVPCPKPVGG